MDNKKLENKIIVVGMARSGTTLLTNILGGCDNVKVVLEPHALWKTGNFNYYNDEEYDITPSAVQRIRKYLTDDLNGRTLIEKSPINCVRPNLVHEAFPDAKIIYIERDPVRCIHSNLKRSLKNDSFKPSIVLKKYFGKAGSDDLPHARSKNSLFSQVAPSDIPYFIGYISYMLYQRNIGMKTFPFGTKLKGFKEIVENNGVIAYHVKVLKKATELKEVYKKLYGESLLPASMEDIMNDKSEIKRILDFAQIGYSEKIISKVHNQLDRGRIKEANSKSKYDKEIERLLDF